MFFMNSLTLFRYTLVHIGFWLGVTWCVAIGVISCGEVLEMARRAGGKLGFLQLLTLAALRIPHHTDYFLPFAGFIAARLSLWRLQKRRELIALNTIGVSGFFWIRTYALLALVLGTLHLCVLQPMSAAFQSTWVQYEEEWLHKRSSYRFAVVTSGLWLREEFPAGYRIIHAKNIADQTIKTVRIYEWSHENRFQTYIEATQATLGQHVWRLLNAKVVTSSGEQQTHENYDIPTQLVWNNVISSQVSPNTLSIWRVGEWLPLLKDVGLSTRPYLMHWHRQIAQVGLITALLLWALVTMPLSLVWIMSGLIIYSLNDVVQALGQAGHIPMVLSVWCVPLVLMLMSIAWLIHREEKAW